MSARRTHRYVPPVLFYMKSRRSVALRVVGAGDPKDSPHPVVMICQDGHEATDLFLTPSEARRLAAFLVKAAERAKP